MVKAFERDTPSVLLSDIRMHDMSGLDLLAFVKNKYPGLPVIIMTAFSDLDSAVSAFQGGAYEYLAKPFDINSAIDLLRRAREESAVAESTDASELDERVKYVARKSSVSREPCRRCFVRSVVCRTATLRCF